MKCSGNTPDVTLAYDNMCNLDKLKASRSPLPFHAPLDKMWINVKKIIDVFHFSNHISPLCRRQYSPVAVKEAHPEWNTQAGEQTFAWLSRFKHILSAQCQNSIISSLFIVWFLDAMLTLVSATSMAENLYYLSLTDVFICTSLFALQFNNSFVCTSFTVYT